MRNQFLSRINRLVIALIGVMVLGIGSAYAGTAYTNGRAFLKQGSPTGGGKVYVASNATEPAASAYKAVTSSTSPAFNVQVAGNATFHYWAVANAGYIFTGWYDANGTLQSSGAAHFSKAVTAGTAGTSDTHAYADYYASFIKQIQMSFVVPTNGSFTITHCGSEVTPAYSSFTTEGKVVLTALPADGYKLRGWYTTTNGGTTKSYFAFGPSCEPNFTSNVTIGAEFVPDDGKATFWIKGTNQIYDNLTSANTAAASSSSKLIVVVSDGTVGAGTYEISSGVTLLIPYEETYNLMTKPNIKHITSATAAARTPSIFRKLTLAPGATINVSGNICIGGSQASVNGGNPSSFPTGPVGMLDLSRGGTINLASGSNLYAWGYVKGQDMDQGNNTAASGVGEINAASGATVWEDYQVGEWRGGTASSTIYNNKGSWKFFPFQSYTVQNIEAPVNYAYGSNLKCYWTIFGNGSVYDVNFPLIASSGSLFKLASGGTVRKWYDPTTDHVCFEMGGTAALDALTLTVMGESVSSSDYYLPIPANLKIILKSGNNLTVSKPMTMHAGSVVEVKSGATLTVNNRVHLFDADDWDTYCMYAYYYRTYYSPSLHFNRGEGTAKTTLEDATVIVDGTVDVKGAYLYSSAHGSNICGNGGGTFKYAALPSNTTMTQCKELKDNVSVNIRSANLHNDNGTYTKGIASTTFKNVNGRWFTNAASTIKANKTYDFTYISSGDVYGTGGTNKTVAACWSKDKTGLELQDKWANIKTQGCTDWWEGIDDSHLYNWSRNSAWHQYIKAGSTTTGSGEDAVTTDTYAGSDGKMLYKTDCEFVDAGSIDGNCLYPSNKALVNGSLISVTANTSPDHGYHKSDAASTYYLCFEGCVWHPATRNDENLYTVDGTKYIWYGDKWMAVEYDSGVSLYYSLSATNVKIYYEYVNHAWTLAVPVAEVTTSAGTEQVFSLANAITKAKAGGTNVTIRLLKNMSISTFVYDGANNCGLDLNGFTLSSATTSAIQTNHANATLIIKDQSAAGTGKINIKFSRSDNKVFGLNVTKGHIVLNSGTVHVENTHASQGACGVVVKTGHKFTMNGGILEIESKGISWGIETESTTTSVVTINGGTIEAKTTSAAAGSSTSGSEKVSGIYSLGGTININGGSLTAIATNAAATYIKGVNLGNANSTLTISGGTITASANSTDYGVYVTAGSTANINGGSISATTTAGTSRGVLSYGTTTINGGTIAATAGTSNARAIYVANNTTTINAGATITASAASDATGIHYEGASAVVVVNGGAITATTTSTTNAYGVNATTGTGTINDGTFTVTAKTTGAYGMYVGTANTPKLTLNGGKFMVKNSDGAAAGTINNTGATLANFAMAGGYFNVAPNGTTNIAAGKTVKDLDATVEADLIAAGYTKKIAGNEYTVTWKSYDGNTVLKTEKVESGKVPVWTGTIPDQSTSTTTREANGWCTEKKNGGTNYATGTPLPAIGASDVTYFVHVQTIYAEVIANGTTTRYTNISGSSGPWAAALKCTNATIRILSNYGTEAGGGKCKQLVFNPTNANSTITFDLNGHSWVMGNNETASENKDVFLKVSPEQANCKLIITDNSASGNGYLMNKQAYSANLLCANVTAGELLLQGGGIKVNNTHASCNAVGVQANGGVFNMIGGLVESKKEDDAVTSGTASGVYAYSATNISGGTIRATNTKASAVGLYLFRNTFTTTLSDDVHVITNGSQSYAVYGYGTVEVSGGTYDVTAEKVSPATWSTARGVYMFQSSSTYFGKATVKGNPVFNVTGVSGAAYGVYSYNHASVESVVEGGTFNVTTTGAGSSIGVTAHDQATTTVKGGTFNVSIPNAAYEQCFGAYAQTNGIVNIEGGTFTVSPTYVGGNNDCARISGGDDTQLNISGGTFTSTNCAYGVRCFNGTTRIAGNPVFSARYGIDVATWASLSGNHTATVIVDGGTFIATTGSAIRSNKNERVVSEVAYNVYGDMTVWDGKFYSGSNQPIDASSGTSYLKIRGGYYSTYTSSNVSNLNKYVVSPSTTEAYATTIDGKAYTYRVNTKYNVTWSVNGVNTVQEYNRNETPSYGSTPTISDGNTWEFLGWDKEIVPVTGDVTYTAQFQKWEAEVYEGENPTPTRFQYFTDAFREAQELPVAKIKVISDVYYGTSLTLNPTEAAGSKPLTIDLNNHVVNYTPKTATYALTINKAGCKLIIDDSSVAKGGQFGHRQTANNGATISAIYIQNGELELAGGTIIAQNNNTDASTDNSKGTRAVVGNSGTVFTMTGGKLYAKSRFDARAFNSGGTCTFNATGGTIEATCEYTDGGTQWGSNAYGVVLWNYGTFNMSGTATMNVTAGAGALGVYPYGAGGTGYPEVNISGGSINCLTKTGGSSRCVQTYGARATTNISGGDITANGPAGQYNIEDVTSQDDATVNITGGNFHSSTGANCVGVRVFSGTVTIGGTAFFDSRHGVVVGDWATSPTSTATAYVNGGTFDCPEYVLFAKETTNEYDSKNHYTGTVTGTMYVNGGYFKTASGNYICGSSSGVGRLILNGGYYNETSGTTQKSNITTYKGATTEVSTLSPAITVSGTTYHYQLLTDFDITWLGGDSYSKVTTLKSGTIPTNNELDGKCFLRNDSAFYFTGWSPTPTAVTGDVTYNALGVYHEASVKVGSAEPIIYDDFDEAWSYAMDQASATITLLSNITRTTSIVYNPAPANARHTLDLNNFTIKENTTDRLLIVNKADAKLTITDNSSEKGGRLYKKMDCSVNICTSVIYHGELILAGGKLYVENTKDERVWHPAECVHVSRSTDGIFTMTGGTVESQAKYLAYTLYNYATTNISGGTIIANATTQGSAQGLYAVAGTATISGGTWNITSETSGAVGVAATGWVNTTGTPRENGVLNITGGTFNVSAATSNVQGVKSYAVGKRIDGTNYTARGILNVSGGTFNVTCSAATATQVFAAQVDGWRLFDEATPHNMIGEERGEMNISGGTFTVDTRDNGAWVENGGNVDLLRCWGDLNVTGGNFTIYQNNNSPCAIGVYRGKTTVSGNPVFNVHAHTSNARGVEAGIWQADTYCDANAANNLAEAEINGGTFKVITEGSNTEGVYAVGALSSSGYAMNAKITVNGGEFLCICPNLDKHYPMVFSSVADKVGTYGTAKSEIYVNGGKVKSRKGTEADNTTTGAVNCHNATGKIWLTGGYYETNAQLTARKADTCDIVNITSAEIDPEYNNGYRYRIDIHYVAQVTATGIDRKFATLKGALDYARTVNNSTVTILNDCDFETDGQYGYGLGTTGKTMTIDLNNHTVNATNSETSYDRVFGVTGQITITDNSVAKGGKLNLTKAHNGTFLGIVFNDASQLTLANGTIYVENTTASKPVEALNIWGTTGIFRQTGGTLQAKATSGTATGVQMRGTAQISGGNITVTSVGSTARAFSQSADAANSKYSSLTVSSTPTITVSGAGEVSGVYANVAGTTTTISGGTWNISSTTSTAYGVRLSKANTATISGGTFNATATTTNAYGVYVSAGGSATVSGGTFTSRTGANKNESFGAYATGTGTTLNITGGTFDANSADNAGGNINVVRVQPGATVTISGGTFRSGANSGYGLVAFGGVTTVSGTALFEAQTGAYVGSWYSGDGTNDELATVNLNGGTFNVKGVAINVTWNTRYKDGVYLDSPFVNSIVNVNGGRYKTTGGTIVQKKANGADGGTAVLHIAGGYFNEKSSTTFKDQISPYVADTSRINTLDPLYEGIYKYEVAPHYVAKVKTGSTTNYYTTAKRALDYAKTVANPTITLLDNCTLTDANYTINPGATWTGTLDLNNFTLTPTIDATYGRAFTIGGTGTKFIVTDNSEDKGGQIYYKGNSEVPIIYFVMGANASMELAGGTLYVENTNAEKKAIGFVVDGNPSKFTQSGGTFTIKGAYGANGYYGRGTATFTGGTMNVDGGVHQAIGLFPQESTSVLNVSGSFALNVTSSLADSYGVLVKNSGATGTISGGKFNFNQNTMVGAQLDGSLTITGGYFNEKSGTTYKTQIAEFVPDTCDLNTLDPLYESKYKYQVVVHHVAKVVESGGAETYFALLTSALDFFKTKNNATLIMLDNAELPASPSRYTLIPTISNWRGTWDLNDKTVSCTYVAPGYAMFDLNKADAILTITDNSVAKRGRLEHIESSASGAVWGLNIENGEIVLAAGTIYAKNTNADATGSKVGMSVKNANSRFTMNGGRIECVGSTGSQGLVLSGGSTATVSGGKIISIAELNETVGNYAYGIYMSGTSTLTVNGADSIYAKAGNADNTRAYSLNAGGGTVTIEGTPFFIAESPTKGARALQSAGSASVTVNGGTFESKAGTTDSYALIAEGTSTMTVNGGKYKTNQNNIAWANTGAGATLTINGGYYNESSGTNHKTRVANYLGSGKVILNLDAADAEYIAGYRYLVTADPVAKVKDGSTITYHTTIADAITAANATTGATLTMLKNVSMTAQDTITSAMTIDLNGKTITCTQAKARAAFRIDASGKTVTILDNGTGGKIDHTANVSGIVYGLTLIAGSLDIQGGTIYAKNTNATENTDYRAYGVYTAASTTLTVSGGTIEAECPNNSCAWGIYSNGALTMTGGEVTSAATDLAIGVYERAGTAELSNVTVTTNAADSASIAIYDYSGTLTVHSGTYTSTGERTVYAIYARNNAAVSVTVEGGKFSGTTRELYKGTNATASISGGYYVHNTTVKDNCAPNHILPASLTEGGITYNYEVAEAYTLTWNLDGGSIATPGTPAGLVKPGATLTAPIVTKTGYTFSAWSPAVAATMPAANTTYTATWTRDTYTISYDLAGGSVASPNPTSYTVESGAITLNNPTKANYVFAGWTGTGLDEATMTVTIPAGSTGNRSYTATWTPAVASVTINSGTPSYHTTLADAFNTAKSAASNATTEITVLKDILDITSQIIYDPTNVCTTTLNLNGHLVQGAVTGGNHQLIRFSPPSGKRSAILEITDSSTGGKLHNEAEYDGKLYCIYVDYGHLKISGGTVSVKNTSTGSSRYSYAIDTRSSANAAAVQFTMTGGTVKAEGDYRVYAVVPRCTANISGGKIEAEANTSTAYAILAYSPSTSSTTISGTIDASAEAPTVAQAIYVCGSTTVQGGTFSATATSGKEAYGIRVPRGTVEVTGNPEFTVTAKTNAYGVFAGAAPTTDAVLNNGHAIIRGGTFTISTTIPTNSDYKYAYGVYANAGGVNGKTGYEGVYASAGTIDVYDGTFDVTAYNRLYGIASMGTVTQSQSGYESVSATPKINIYGGKFKVTKKYSSDNGMYGAVCATSATITNSDVVIEGGYFNTNANNYLDQYTAPTKSCNYHIFNPTDLPAYPYKVAEAYSLTWNLDGGTVTTAGTMAPVDATGTPSGFVAKDAALTAPVIARDGYVFAGWTPAVAATMPAANTTYTAQWAVASVTTNDVTTLYTDINAAWTAVTSATAASTLTMLQDVAITGKLNYTNTQNCTLDLNGYTITSTTNDVQSPLHINSAVTFTITDGSVGKSGKLSMTSNYSDGAIFGACADNGGTLVLDAGTIEVKNSSSRTTCGVTVQTSGTFTMNGGTIHVVATNDQKGRGIYLAGAVTVNSGTVHVEAAGDGYGIDRAAGNITVNDGKFNITSSSGTPYITNQTNNTYVKIYGGYYNINTRLGTCVTAPKYVFRTTAADKASVGEDYEYKVTTGYVITYNKGANGTGTIASGTKAHGDDFTLSSSTFTRTGYTQTGWSTSDGGAKAYELGGTYAENADITLYPFWSANNYTVTLNNQSATTAGTISITVTYNSNTNLTATPAITVPTKTGYTFGGYYTEQGGKGKQVIAANGNVNASVSGITDASKNWIASTGGTIYAKWTQTVTLHDNNGGIHNGSLEVTYNLAYKSGTPPTREGYTAEGYYAEPACTNKVLTTAADWVNYSGWVEGGKWVHDGESTLYTKWIEDTHTVTVAAGANGSASPASVTAGITTASGDITATPNTGYHFTNWTLVSGVTAASTYSTTSNPIRINATADGKTITANFAANTNTAYTVKHYKQNLAGDGYDLADTDNLTGTTGASVTPAVKSYTGFTAPSTQTETIAADGSLVIEYQYTRNSYTLTWALDGGSITAAGTAAGSVKYGASLMAPTVTKAGYNFTGWSPSVPSTMPAANSTYTATWEQADLGFYVDIVDVDNTNLKLIVNVTSWAASGWPYTINGVEYAKNAREADRTLKIPYVGTPGDNYAIMVKKTGGDVISHHTYVIPQEITSNSTISTNQTKNLYVKDGVNLTVNENITARNIYVAPEATLTINSGKTLTADSIFLRTTADHAAEMVLSGNLAGTTQLVYTRIIKDKDFHLFGIPLSCDVEDVHLSDGFVPTYKTGWVLRYYNEKRRSNEGADDNNWATVKEDSTITGGSGYELFSGSNYYREFYFPVDHTELTNEVAVVYDLGAAGEKNAGWNAITSPFTSTYTNVKVPEGLAVSWYMGGYYSQEIPTTIPAATVFAFQATKTGTISFEGESIVAALPRRAATEEAVRIQWLDLDIADANGVGDQTSIYSHPTRYDAVFQKGIDIAKQSFEAPRAIIYSSHAYGEMAFAGVADSLLEQGVALTVYSPTAQPLTISMRDNDWLNRMKYVWLIDHQTGERTDLLWENYTYEASEGTTRGRFTIQGVFRTPTITTDIENGMMNDESMQVEKFILNDKIYIRVNGHLYDATGKLVNRK